MSQDAEQRFFCTFCGSEHVRTMQRDSASAYFACHSCGGHDVSRLRKEADTSQDVEAKMNALREALIAGEESGPAKSYSLKEFREHLRKRTEAMNQESGQDDADFFAALFDLCAVAETVTLRCEARDATIVVAWTMSYQEKHEFGLYANPQDEAFKAPGAALTSLRRACTKRIHAFLEKHGEAQRDLVEISFDSIVRESGQARLYTINGERMWLPLSILKNETSTTFEIPRGLAKDRGLV